MFVYFHWKIQQYLLWTRGDAKWCDAMGMVVLLAETAKFASSAFSSRCAAGSCASAISPTKKLSSLYYERSVYNLLQHKHFLSNGNTSCERRERKRERVRVEGCQIGRGSVLFLHLIALSISFSLLLGDGFFKCFKDLEVTLAVCFPFAGYVPSVHIQRGKK